jgi:hypothetical protein
VVLIEGNDRRLIDVGLISKLPLGGVTSWQHTSDPENPASRCSPGDLLQVEVLSADRRRRLLTVFNNHLKSHFVPLHRVPTRPPSRTAPTRCAGANCEAAAAIIAAQPAPPAASSSSET